MARFASISDEELFTFQPSALADNTNLVLDNYRYHAQPHPKIVYYTVTI
jgi:hypothetical protein